MVDGARTSYLQQGLVGDNPLEYKIYRGFLYGIFLWLIHVATLGDPWFVLFFKIEPKLKLYNKGLCSSL
jgi:hypothetical protein